MTQEIYLIKHVSTNDVVYHVSNLNNLSWSIDTPVTPMPLPEDTHEENILVKMEGNTAKIDLSWTLTEGSFFGTLNNDVFTPETGGDITALAQIQKFKGFVPKSIGDSYSIKIVGDGGNIDKGTISNMSFNISGSSPIVWIVQLQFYVGNVVAMLESDIPPAPTSVTLVGSTSTITDAGTIAYTVVPYDGYATEPTAGSAQAVSGHKIKYKKTQHASAAMTDDLNTWITPSNASSSLTGTITGLPHGDYTVKIAQLNGFSADAGTEYYRKGATTTSTTVVVG
jgi:hypothetical protein